MWVFIIVLYVSCAVAMPRLCCIHRAGHEKRMAGRVHGNTLRHPVPIDAVLEVGFALIIGLPFVLGGPRPRMTRGFLVEARRNGGSPSEVVVEVERILVDGRDYLAQEIDLYRAMARATIDADRRYVARGTGEGPEPLAGHIALWLARRANRGSAVASLNAAVAAVDGDAEAELSADLSAFVSTYFDGSMSNRKFEHLLNNPTDPVRPPT
jgi:hypothetical protein